MLIRHSGTIDEEKKTQQPILRRHKVLETLVLTNKGLHFFIFYIKLFEQLHEKFFLKKIWVK